MPRNEMQRSAILQLWSQSKSKHEIAETLDCDRHTVIRVIQQHEDAGNADEPGSSTGRPRTARTATLVSAIRQKVRRNPERQIRKLSRDHSVGVTTMHRLVKEDLGLKSLKKTEVPMLTRAAKQRRLDRAATLLHTIEATGTDNVVYSDEKQFCISQQLNRQNDRVLAPSRNDIPAGVAAVERQKSAASVMVWAAVSAGWKSELVFLPQGTKITAAIYQEHVLNGPVLNAARNQFRRQKWIFTQDGAPSHTAQSSRRWFQDNKVPLLENWPPSSPELNPMDFYVWDALQRAASSKPHSSVSSLKAALQAAWEGIPQATIAKACRKVPRLAQQVIDAKGEHIDS